MLRSQPAANQPRGMHRRGWGDAMLGACSARGLNDQRSTIGRGGAGNEQDRQSKRRGQGPRIDNWSGRARAKDR
eukprot:5937306-Prymnesium_polylepis.1